MTGDGFTSKKIIFATLALGALAFSVWMGVSRLKPVKNTVTGKNVIAEEVVVTKVIDGDTVVVSGGDHVRLLGIDADEKDYPCYDAARRRLEELVLGKTVALESDNQDTDQYERRLRYIFLDGKNINEQLAAEGLVVARFYPENQKYKNEVTAAEAAAMKNKTGCKWSGQDQTASSGVGVVDDNGNSGNDPDAVYEWKDISGSAITPCQAKDHTGKEVIVEGVVAQAYRSDSDTVFLDFGAKYPNNCFTVVIFKSSLTNFPENPENVYNGKMVRVKGVVKEYESKPEMIIKNRSQIELGTAK